MSKIKMSDIQLSKHYDHFMGERRPFWRADYQRETIVTLCRTKTECLKEVRQWIGKQNKVQKPTVSHIKRGSEYE